MRFPAIFFAVILGVILTFSPAGVFVLILFLISLYLIKVFIKTTSQKFLIKLFIVSFIIRVVLSFINYHVGFIGPSKGADTQPDAIVYNNYSFYVACALRGLDKPQERINDVVLAKDIELTYAGYHGKLPSLGIYQFNIYVFLLGILNAWLGYSPIAAKVINGLLGCLSIIVVYCIARKLFETESTAKLSAVLFAFYPSIAYWSVTTLRDPLINFIFLLYFLYLIIFLKQGKILTLLILFLLAYCFDLFKAQMHLYFILIGEIIFVAILSALRKILFNKKTFLRLIVLFSFILTVLLFISVNKNKVLNLLLRNLNEVVDYHHGHIREDPSATNYKIYPAFIYAGKKFAINDIFSMNMIFSIIKAWLYFFFSPFPWNKWTKNFLIFYPQVIFTYFLFPLVVIGMMSLFRKNAFIASVIFSFLFILITAYALAGGVMGIVFRHRDTFVPLGLILAAHTVSNKKWELTK